jgi:Ca-activated chloride channel family protein
MAEFHFLRPLWLVLLPVAIWAAWRVGTGRGGRDGWRNVVDLALQPYVLAAGDKVSQRRWPLITALGATLLAALALAGPSWEHLPVPAFRSDEALVVLLDLSRSMDAADIEPTRLARARLKLLDLLERRESGQTALVVFSSNAFTVTPLTNDTRTIAALVSALTSDIMPSQGSLVEVGLDKASALLRQSGVSGGEILVITDATAAPAAFDRVADLHGAGIVTHILGVGTEEGAPIPDRDGGFVTDASGQVVVPQLNVDNLRRLAAAGGGRFARLATSDSDLDRLFPADVVGSLRAGSEGEQFEADIWLDRGVWLTLALLPLVALGFRRGWIYLVVAGLMLPLPRAEAFAWRDLWLRPDQQGQAALERSLPEQAATLFEDPEWAAAAMYQAGQYDASAAELSGVDSPDAHYNRGNALARAGKLAEAVSAYDRALELAPDHADAEYNRELVADLLEQQQEQQQQEQQSDEGQQNESGEPQPDEQQASQSDSGSGEEQQGSQDASEGSDESRDTGQSEQQTAANDEPTSEPEPPDNDEQGEQADPGDQPLQAAATPQAVEDWASEQAADQWLRRIPQDPGGLLRRKFLYQYQQLGIDQDGNRIYRGSEAEPW